MSINDSESFITILSKHVTNINGVLKNIKSEVITDFIWKNHRGLIITTNKVVADSNLNTIKNIDIVNSEDIMSLRLPQSKLYFKVLGIPYYIKDKNIPITSDIIKKAIQTIHIFNNTILASCPYIIKALSKSDMAII